MKQIRKLRQILSLLLTAALLFSCTGCIPMSFPVVGSEKLAAEPLPAQNGNWSILYAFPFTATQANLAFFGEQDTVPMDHLCGYELRHTSNTQWYILNQGNMSDNPPEDVLGGRQVPGPMRLVYMDSRKRPAGYWDRSWSLLFEPESGTLKEAVEYHPVNDPVYDQILTDSAAKLQTLGYSSAQCVYSTKLDQLRLHLLNRATGSKLEEQQMPYCLYLVQYTLYSADVLPDWTDAFQSNQNAVATFYYNADGELYHALLEALPDVTYLSSEPVRYTAEEAFQLLPTELYRPESILVDVYFEPVSIGEGSGRYQGCWTFRFVEASNLHLISDDRVESMLHLLGISGKYLTMQCHVNAYTGKVTGSGWKYSNHLIHEYNGKDILSKN